MPCAGLLPSDGQPGDWGRVADYTEVDAPLGTKWRFTRPEIAWGPPLLSLSRVFAGHAM